jgi:hypothetical protein
VLNALVFLLRGRRAKTKMEETDREKESKDEGAFQGFSPMVTTESFNAANKLFLRA